MTNRTPPHMRYFPKVGFSADIHHHHRRGMIASAVPCLGCRQQELAYMAFFVLHLRRLHKKDSEAHRTTQATQLWIRSEDSLELVASDLALAVVVKAW